MTVAREQLVNAFRAVRAQDAIERGELPLAADLVAACEAQGFFEEITEAYRQAEKEKTHG